MQIAVFTVLFWYHIHLMNLFIRSADYEFCLKVVTHHWLNVIVFAGRFDINHRRYHCPVCTKVVSTSDPAVLIQSGFWPGSISDMTYVFEQDLLLHWDILQKQIPGISERSFIKSLEQFSKQKGRVSICTYRYLSNPLTLSFL